MRFTDKRISSRLSVGEMLTGCFAVLAIAIVTLAAGCWYSIERLSNDLNLALTQTVHKVELLRGIATDSVTMRLGFRGVLYFSTIGQADQVEASRKMFQQSAAAARSKAEQARLLYASDSDRGRLDSIIQGFTDYDAVVREIDPLLAKKQIEDVNRIVHDKVVPIGAKIVNDNEELLRSESQLQQQDLERSMAAKNTVRAFTVVLLFVSVAVGIAVVVVIRRTFKQLQQVTGDLAQGAEQVASAASQVSSSSHALAQGASEQAASLEETSASTEEINAMIQKNADSSKDSAKLMVDMADQISEGNRKLNDMIVSMDEINASSEKISKIIKAIDGIAFQTNILALNAAVEAARAGDAGMGFAVVADEVRNLAQRCAQAAKDTADLIEDSIAKSHEGSRRLDGVAKALAAITEDADRVKTLVDEVSLGSQEQARGLGQIGQAILQMEEVTQKTAATAEESSAAGEELSAQSEALQQLAVSLAELVGGDRHPSSCSTAIETPVAARPPKFAARKPSADQRESEWVMS